MISTNLATHVKTKKERIYEQVLFVYPKRNTYSSCVTELDCCLKSKNTATYCTWWAELIPHRLSCCLKYSQSASDVWLKLLFILLFDQSNTGHRISAVPNPLSHVICCTHSSSRVWMSGHESCSWGSEYILNKILRLQARLLVSCFNRLGLDFPLKPKDRTQRHIEW